MVYVIYKIHVWIIIIEAINRVINILSRVSITNVIQIYSIALMYLLHLYRNRIYTYYAYLKLSYKLLIALNFIAKIKFGFLFAL